MADNYIERQQELYEARKKAWNNSKKHLHKTVKDDHSKRRVFITGGVRGIGCSLVRAFCEAGYKVAFCDTDEKNGRLTGVRTGAVFLKADVRNPEELEQCMDHLFTEWGDIDVLINNAGVFETSPITETQLADFDRIINTNLRPVFITARKLAIHRKLLTTPNPYGRIINLCSTRSQMSEPDTEGYAASKGGIYSLTHALAVSLSEWHITVNSLSPGWIVTDDSQNLQAEDHEQHPCGRAGRPEDIARMCLFLAQPDNDFIDGENITIDGGMTRKMIYTK